MEVMAREQHINHNSEVYLAGINQFENNLEKILKVYKKNNIPVLLSTVVSNEKDIQPFISESIKDENWFIKALEENNLEANQLAQNNAMAAYKLGRYYLEINQDTAKKYLHLAKELDFLRFRAPKKINIIIDDLAKKYECSIVDMETIFLSHSAQGVIGDDLLTEHLHPNVKGYFVMADAFYNKIKELNFLSGWDNYIAFDDAFTDIPITDIDSIKGRLIINDLKQSWPYDLSKSGELPRSTYYNIVSPTYEEKRAFHIYTNQSQWKNVMIEAYETYKRKKEYRKALRIAQSLIFEYPEQGDGYHSAGTLCMKMDAPEKAVYYFYKGNQLDKTSASVQQLATVYMKLNKMDLAQKTLLEAKKSGINDEVLNNMIRDLSENKD
jgi:tetratricopeptide (TPR) repeat protein